jgi:uncharacterized membrane protein
MMITTNRIEAFSDGIIAILITIMVFDLKIPDTASEAVFWQEIKQIIPKFISYLVSFIMLAIMWVNHHQLFHQIKHTDIKLLWYSIHLLFWMSLIPFCTNFIGEKPYYWEASFFYGLIFFMSALSFTLLRSYVIKSNLLHETIDKQRHIKIKKKNLIALCIYAAGALTGIISVYLSFTFFLIVPMMYFIPEKIIHENKN